jgi:hypothetical protein
MDYVEPVEFDDESIEFINDERAKVTLHFKFKSGLDHYVTLNTPVDSPVYGEPITVDSIYSIITSALALAESPYLILPCGESEQMFVDLSSVDFVKVKVVEHE